ncbi:MAG: helix-turn-helix domain-containing protein [Bacilli bacterium]|nr:helix-turn-helix domain-containing protein [Bacilli bacterium]
MKEIGERFKEARESIDITVEEAAEDLKVDKSQIENIETGNIKACENVVALKYLIKDYSKYLGLDAEEMLDEYNEYLFDCTSKISLEDIKAAKRRLASKQKEEDKVKSPYTQFRLEHKRYHYLLIGAALLMLFMAIYVTVTYIDAHKNPNKNNEELNVIR